MSHGLAHKDIWPLLKYIYTCGVRLNWGTLKLRSIQAHLTIYRQSHIITDMSRHLHTKIPVPIKL